jgi:hypothetical protein
MIKIAGALTDIQQKGGENNFVILKAGRNYYIQFATSTGQSELYAEAVSNHYLSPENALSDDQIAVLESLGWMPQMNGNHYRNWEADSDERRVEIARQVIRTFMEVYGIPSDIHLEMELVLE